MERPGIVTEFEHNLLISIGYVLTGVDYYPNTPSATYQHGHNVNVPSLMKKLSMYPVWVNVWDNEFEDSLVNLLKNIVNKQNGIQLDRFNSLAESVKTVVTNLELFGSILSKIKEAEEEEEENHGQI